MATNNLTTVQFLYKRVIEETIKSSRGTFVNEGIEDSVLQELRQLWENKLASTNAIEPANPPDYVTTNQLYRNPFYKSGNPTNPRIMQFQSPFLAQQQALGRAVAAGTVAGAAPPQQQQQPFPTQFPSLSGVTTISKREFNKASNSIQVDGAVEITTDTKKKRKARAVRQLDGVDSDDDDVGEFIDSDDSEEDESDEEIDVDEKSPTINRIIQDIDQPSVSEPVEEDDPLCSADDDSDDVDGVDIEETDNVVVCLAEKITRSKNKWKLQLKEGVMSIGGRDHVFQKAIGEGEW